MKEKIIELKNSGLSIKDIASILGCALNTVRYHLSDKKRAQQRSRQLRLRAKEGFYAKVGNANSDLQLFKNRVCHANRRISSSKLSIKDVRVKFTNHPFCYLSGRPIDLSKSSTYSIDHILPISRGGDNSIDNVALCSKDLNSAKSDKTPEEFFALCKEVLEFNGYKVIKV